MLDAGLFGSIQSVYADLNLGNDPTRYNFIEISANNLSESTLREALSQAGTTKQDDLIVVRTNSANSIIDLGNSVLAIDINASAFGSVTIVALGSEKLQITGHSASGVIAVADGNVAFGGVFLNATNSSVHIDEVLQKTSSVQLATSQFIRSVERDALVGNLPVGAEYANLGLSSTPLADGERIGTRTYEITVSVGGTLEAYLTGLSLAERNSIVGGSLAFLNGLDPYDAEKTWSGDSNHCWAGASANMLAYTGWGNVNGFQTEDDIYRYISANFTNVAGNSLYANEWFITGNYAQQGLAGWAQPRYTGAGGFHPDTNYRDIAGYATIRSVTGLTSAVNKLKEGAAVSLTIGWYNSPTGLNRSGGHLITMWGAVYDTTLSPTDNGYYVSLLVSDSDDSRPGGPNAPNVLTSLSIEWVSASVAPYLFTSYTLGNHGRLEDYVYLDRHPATPTPVELAAPVINEMIATDSNTVSVNWSAVDNADGYTIQWATSADFENAQTLTLADTSTTLTDLLADTTYYIRVLAIGTGDYRDSDYSAVGQVTTLAATIALTSITSNTDFPQVDDTISTTLAPADATAIYQWFRGDTAITDATSSSYTVTMDDVGYALRVVATGIESHTGIVSHTTNVVPCPTVDPTTPQLDVPAITDVIPGATALEIRWNGVDNAYAYEVAYSTENGLLQSVRINGNATSLVVAGLVQGAFYHITVTAIGSGEYRNSDPSQTEIARTAPRQDISVAINPRGVKAQPKQATIDSVTLRWVVNESNRANVAYNITGIQRGSTVQLTGHTITYIVENNRVVGATISGLEAGKQYVFTVQAFNANGEKANNDARVNANTITPRQAAVKPSAIRAQAKVDSVSLRWNVPTSGIDGYQIRIIGTNANGLRSQYLATFTISGSGVSNNATLVSAVAMPDSGLTKKLLLQSNFHYETLRPGTTRAVDTMLFTVAGLKAGTGYRFEIQTTGQSAAGDFISTVSRISASTLTWPAVRNVKVEPNTRTATSVNLTWQLPRYTTAFPASAEPVTHYEIWLAARGTQPAVLVATLPARVDDVLITGASITLDAEQQSTFGHRFSDSCRLIVRAVVLDADNNVVNQSRDAGVALRRV